MPAAWPGKKKDDFIRSFMFSIGVFLSGFTGILGPPETTAFTTGRVPPSLRSPQASLLQQGTHAPGGMGTNSTDSAQQVSRVFVTRKNQILDKPVPSESVPQPLDKRPGVPAHDHLCSSVPTHGHLSARCPCPRPPLCQCRRPWPLISQVSLPVAPAGASGRGTTL